MKASVCAVLMGMGGVCAAAQVTVMKDLSYLGKDRAEKADIYKPGGANKGALPAVLLIHGGGWKIGDKADARGLSIAGDLAQAGYVVMAINYHLVLPGDQKGGFPQNVYDCKSALRYMRGGAKQFGLDPSRIAILGESAGGHLALLLGSTQKSDDLNKGGLYTSQSNAVQAVVDMYGVYDLTDSKRMLGINAVFRGEDDAETSKNVLRADPVHTIDDTMPPVLILHGTADQTVPFAQSERLAARLKELGVSYEFVPVPGAGHSFNLHPKEMDVKPIVLAFLKKYLGDPQAK